MIPNTPPSPPTGQSPTTDAAPLVGAGSGAQTPTGSNPPAFNVESSVNLYISQVPASYNSTKLRDAFSRFGPIHSAKVMFDPTTNESRCFGFVLFERAEDGHRAMSDMNGVVLEEGSGRLHVRVARPSALPQPLQNHAANHHAANHHANNNANNNNSNLALTNAASITNARKQFIGSPDPFAAAPGPFVIHHVPQESRMHLHQINNGAASAATIQVALPSMWIPNGPLLHSIPTTGGDMSSPSLSLSSSQSRTGTCTPPHQPTAVQHFQAPCTTGPQQVQPVWLGNYGMPPNSVPTMVMMAPASVMQHYQPY